jgi:methionine-rich copper-binding protein CopC
VAITSPTSSYTVAAGSPVELAATAVMPSSGGGIVTRSAVFSPLWIEFFDGATKLGNGVKTGSTTWTFSWNTAGAAFGLHNITARATNDRGASATSAPETVIQIVGLPTVAITTPTSTYTAAFGAAVTLVAAASTTAPGGSIATVDFYDGAARVGRGAAAGSNTWTYSWNTSGVSAGLHNVTARAADNRALSATSSPATVIQIAGPPPAGARPRVATTAAARPAAGGAPRLVAMTPASGAVASGVTAITLVFDSSVVTGGAPVEVSGLATGAHQDYTVVYDAAKHTLTLAWARALPADVYTVRVVADFVIGAGGGSPLDGEVGNPAAAALPSGDGVPGGDAVLRFQVN